MIIIHRLSRDVNDFPKEGKKNFHIGEKREFRLAGFSGWLLLIFRGIYGNFALTF